MAEQQIVERQNSIEVTVDKKGDVAFKAKIYYSEDLRDWEDVNKTLKSIMDDLKSRFK